MRNLKDFSGRCWFQHCFILTRDHTKITGSVDIYWTSRKARPKLSRPDLQALFSHEKCKNIYSLRIQCTWRHVPCQSFTYLLNRYHHCDVWTGVSLSNSKIFRSPQCRTGPSVNSTRPREQLSQSMSWFTRTHYRLYLKPLTQTLGVKSARRAKTLFVCVESIGASYSSNYDNNSQRLWI